MSSKVKLAIAKSCTRILHFLPSGHSDTTQANQGNDFKVALKTLVKSVINLKVTAVVIFTAVMFTVW